MDKSKKSSAGLGKPALIPPSTNGISIQVVISAE
jgi:hypothetical protein